MLSRELHKELLQAARTMPIVSVTGPRQSGKTTLVKEVFRDYAYSNFENHDTQMFAREDPRGLLSEYNNGAIFDEVQNVPEIFSYLQTHVDDKKGAGQYILTGSQNFLLLEKISQSLAGRISLQTLLPFSISELNQTPYQETIYDTYIHKGFYPRIYDENLDPGKWLSSYVQSYIERDVRQIINIGDLSQFQAFLKICAGRIGQLLNLTTISNMLGVSYKTIKRWISVLEASFIIFLLPPYYQNFNKRIIKTPKLYFYDPGLASYLLGIRSEDQLFSHFLRGELFEGLIISELKKYFLNRGLNVSTYFWRDRTGHEIDCVIEYGGKLITIEIKSGKTIKTNFLEGLEYWQKLTGSSPENSYLVYGGGENQKRSIGQVCGWSHFSEIIKF